MLSGALEENLKPKLGIINSSDRAAVKILFFNISNSNISNSNFSNSRESETTNVFPVVRYSAGPVPPKPNGRITRTDNHISLFHDNAAIMPVIKL